MKPKVLIGYSGNFNLYDFFCTKVSKITSSISDFDVYSLVDKNQLIERFFDGKVSKKINYNIRSREIKNIMSDIDYAIFFWDGTDINQFIYNAFLLKIKTRIVTIETTKVVNKDKGDKYDVYIGRGTPWGNPYAIGDEGMTREEVIDKYRKYFNDHFLSDPARLRELKTLKGKILGCHCKPAACHGDIIADYLNSLGDDREY